MIVLDASVIIAFLNTSDVSHGASAVLLSQNLDRGFAVHPLTLAEVLVGGVRLGRASQLLADLTEMGIGALTPARDEPMLLAELRVTTGLTMPDCCVLVAALQESAPLATFDAALARAAVALGLRVVPPRAGPGDGDGCASGPARAR
ncbi:type II toxin-antitoxin system VapC family toxin [Cryobacterium frigoriphilum]|uniref:type II toxin-antitoxin system VapC family toxin n=1 Tax=Cryobacterium frigoriphilum TaxID=1259150 RepID=UPI00141AEF1E|nr:type II toxin-antitoxin system VapC family toxin [Cryobacterium frigoriphilum]